MYLEGKCLKFPESKIRKENECTANALDVASTKNGLTNEWKTFQSQIEKHLEAWKQCPYSLYVPPTLYSITVQKKIKARNF